MRANNVRNLLVCELPCKVFLLHALLEEVVPHRSHDSRPTAKATRSEAHLQDCPPHACNRLANVCRGEERIRMQNQD